MDLNLPSYETFDEIPLNRWVIVGNPDSAVFCYRHSDGATFTTEGPPDGPPTDEPFFFDEEIRTLARFLQCKVNSEICERGLFV